MHVFARHVPTFQGAEGRKQADMGEDRKVSRVPESMAFMRQIAPHSRHAPLNPIKEPYA